MRRFQPLAAIFVCALSAVAQAHLPITEKIEWTWSDRPDTTSPALPNVLLIGDSITRAYYPEVAKQLSGEANVYLFATSAASGDPRLARQLGDYFRMMGLGFQVIHFNNGMHGWGYTEEQYASELPAMVAALRAGAPKARLIWASTTAVLHDSETGQSTNARIDQRNRLAAALMAREGISVDDQHALMLPHPEFHDGDVHFTTAGSALQATQVASALRPLLPRH